MNHQRAGTRAKWQLYNEIDPEIFKKEEEKEKWYIADLRQADGPVGTQVMRFHVGLKRLTSECFVRCGENGPFQRVKDLKFGLDHFHHLGQDLNTFMDMLRGRYDDDDDDLSSSDDDVVGVSVVMKEDDDDGKGGGGGGLSRTESQVCLVS